MFSEVRCASCGYMYELRSRTRAVCPRCWAAASSLQKIWRFVPLLIGIAIALTCLYLANMKLSL